MERNAQCNEMDDLSTVRSLTGLTRAFHSIYAAIDVWLPLMMIVAEWRWRRTNDPVYLLIAKCWAKGKAIHFVVGAGSPSRNEPLRDSSEILRT